MPEEPRVSITNLMTKFVTGNELNPTEQAEIRNRIGSGTGSAGDELEERTTALEETVTTVNNDLEDIKEQLAALNYVAPVITSFTNNVVAVEKGTLVNDITLTWAINKTLTTGASININQGIGSKPINATNHVIADANLSTDRTYTLTVDDGTTKPGHIVTRTTDIKFQNKLYWGTSAKEDDYTSADILALPNKVLSATKVRNITLDGEGKYILFASPVALGPVNFVVEGFVTTFVPETIGFLNASGYQEQYYVYRSQYIQNGTDIAISTN
ncbi:MAG: hypothetical protein ABW007_19245 [Chitinophagaceae bacterium]